MHIFILDKTMLHLTYLKNLYKEYSFLQHY
uniref:Uncharacterized protein n=1 Tax=virus sp. ctrcb4 TaxID=2825824 RepID=A0A8S5RPT8_9VIRU|nr:MAG TPA: hypothetical protein [virus sp. ctrcb4]